jgi:hypothetical protein
MFLPIFWNPDNLNRTSVYRPFFAAFFPRDWLNGLFSIMMFYQQLSPLEYRKGSMFAFLFPVIVATLTNWIFLLFMFIVAGGKISSQVLFIFLIQSRF